MRVRFLVHVLIACILLASIMPLRSTCEKGVLKSGLMDSPWPAFQHDVRHTGRSPYTLHGYTAVPKWKVKLGGHDNYHSPVIDKDGTIYVGSDDTLCAINPDGSIKWRSKLGWYIVGSPVIGKDGKIYVHAGKKLFALLRNGAIKWDYNLKYEILRGEPVVDENGIIYVTAFDLFPTVGGIYAFYPNGTLKWFTWLNRSIDCSPALYNDTLYIETWDGKLYAIYTNNGSIKWECDVGGYAYLPITVGDDGTIYAHSGGLTAVSPNGTIKWTFNRIISSSPAISYDGTIYFGSGDSLYALHPNGTVKWKITLIENGTVDSSPAVDADGVVYITADNGYDHSTLFAVYPNGTIKWKYWMKTLTQSTSPVIGKNNTIYQVAFSGSYLHCLEVKDGADVEIERVMSGLAKIMIDFTNTGIEPAENVSWRARIYYNTFIHYLFYDSKVKKEVNGTLTRVDIGEKRRICIDGLIWPGIKEMEIIVEIGAENANPDGAVIYCILIGVFPLIISI